MLPKKASEQAIKIELNAQPTVRLDFQNPKGLNGHLFLIEKTEAVCVHEFGGANDQRYELPSGRYKIVLKDGTQLAVPAIQELTQKLTVTTLPIPKPKAGWCWIPAGPAVIGDTLGIGAEDERPARTLEIPGFWLAATEVTNADYAKFLNDQSSVEENWIDLRSRKCRIKKVSGTYQTDAPQLPVVMVSLSGAAAYCDWLSEKLGQSCRLPTEQEWEKAARGPESYVYSYGNVYQQSLANQESGTLKDVKSYKPNSFGLYDMTGNVFEWMSNQYDPARPNRSMNQALRGGSFVLDGMYLRNSFRMRQSPSVMTDDIGFRVLMEPKNEIESQQ
jgi:formylglycine-generating enzyme required for sulfatase activity